MCLQESVKIFPLDSSLMPDVRKRLSLARQIDQIERKGSRVIILINILNVKIQVSITMFDSRCI